MKSVLQTFVTIGDGRSDKLATERGLSFVTTGGREESQTPSEPKTSMLVGNTVRYRTLGIFWHTGSRILAYETPEQPVESVETMGRFPVRKNRCKLSASRTQRG